MIRTFTHHSPSTSVARSAPDAETAGPVAPGCARALAAASRRAVLAGGTAALALVARPTLANGALPTGPDATLVALCAELDAMQREIDALFPADWTGVADSTLEAADAAARLIEDQQRVLLDRICTFASTSLAGCVALARSVALLRPDLVCTGPDTDPDVRLTAVLVRSLVGKDA